MQQLLLERRAVRFDITGNQHGALKVKAQRMSVADSINDNGRVYPLAILQREVDKLQTVITERRLIGAADHPLDGRSRIADAAVQWTKVWLEGTEVHGEGIVLPTQKGKDLEACIRAGVALGVSQRGWGSIIRQNWHGQDAQVATEDFALATWDIVLDAAVEGSQLALAEQKTTNPQEGVTPMKLTSEKAFQRKMAGLPIADVEIANSALPPLPDRPLTHETIVPTQVQRFREGVTRLQEQEKLGRHPVSAVKRDELTRQQKIERQLAGFEHP